MKLILRLLLLIPIAVLGQVTDPGYELPKPLPPTGATPPTVIKPGGSFAPTAYNDARPGMYDVFIWGGHRSVGTLAERDAAKWRKEGMTVYVAETAKTYKLNSAMAWVETDPGSDIIYLRDYGAVGNGTTDDTAAFNAALAASENKILDIGQGLYVISPTTITNNVCIVGHHIYGMEESANPANASRYSGFMKKAGTSGRLLTLSATNHGEMHYVYLSGNAANSAGDTFRLLGGSTARGYVIDHVVIVDSDQALDVINRDDLKVTGLKMIRCIGGIFMDSVESGLFDQVEVRESTAGAVALSASHYNRFTGMKIWQVDGYGLNLGNSGENHFSGGEIGETQESSIVISPGTTNNLFEGVITRNANAQAIPSLPGYTPDAEGTHSAIIYPTAGALDGNTFLRCTINVAHPDSTYQTSVGNRKVQYCVSAPVGTRMTFVDCYFADDRATTGAYPATLPDTAVLINSGVSTTSNQIHYFGTGAAFGNSIAVIKGIGTSPSAGSYPVVWDSTTKQLAASPTAYASAFSWKPMPTKRIKYYAYETFNTAIVGSTIGNGWSPSAAASGTGTTAPTTLGHPTVVRLNTTASVGSGYTISGRLDTFAPDVNERYTMSMMFRIPTISTATDRFWSQVGFGDLANAQDVDGVIITTTDSSSDPAGAGNFRLKVVSNSVQTHTDLATGPVAGAWNGATIVFTTAAANATINGVAFPQNTGTIPTGTARTFCPIFKCFAGTAITAIRSLDVDWFEVIVEDTSQPNEPIASLQFFENMTMPWHEQVAFRVSQ